MTGRQPPLPPAPRAHQLPPKWDDCTVEWGEWQRNDSTLRLHVRPECCPNCGSLTERVLNVGKLRNDGPRVFLARRSRSGYQPGRLFAWRCPDCKHDQVTDLSGVTWDITDDDYTDEGSHAR